MSESTADLAPAFQTRKFSDVAQGLIRAMILEGEYVPGERLNEIVLSDRLRISRPPIREALRALSGEGLVRMVAGKGAFVSTYDLVSVQQLGEVRMALECGAARLAAERATTHQLEILRAALRSTEEALADLTRPYPQKVDFHLLVLEATGNARLAETADGINTQLRLARARSGQSPERAQQALAEHRAIFEALESGDPGRAERAMREHLISSALSIANLLSQSVNDAEVAK